MINRINRPLPAELTSSKKLSSRKATKSSDQKESEFFIEGIDVIEISSDISDREKENDDSRKQQLADQGKDNSDSHISPKIPKIDSFI